MQELNKKVTIIRGKNQHTARATTFIGHVYMRCYGAVTMTYWAVVSLGMNCDGNATAQKLVAIMQ